MKQIADLLKNKLMDDFGYLNKVIKTAEKLKNEIDTNNENSKNKLGKKMDLVNPLIIPLHMSVIKCGHSQKCYKVKDRDVTKPQRGLGCPDKWYV
jgi:hypothetical protein